MTNFLIKDTIPLDRWKDHPQLNPRVRRSSDFTDAVIERFYAPDEVKGLACCWPQIERNLRWRRGEVSLWGGRHKEGKSLVIGQCALGWLSERKVCIASLEMRPPETLERMVRQSWKDAEPPRPYIRAWHEWTNERLWLFDHFGELTPDEAVALMRYCADLGIEVFVLDSLTKLRMPTTGDSAWNKQKDFVNTCCAISRDTGMAIHLVTHLNSAEQIAGHFSITAQVDNIFKFSRNRDEDKSSDEPDAYLSCVGQRHGNGSLGEFTLRLKFHQSSLQYLAHAGPDWAMDLVPEIAWQQEHYEPGTDEPVVWNQEMHGA